MLLVLILYKVCLIELVIELRLDVSDTIFENFHLPSAEQAVTCERRKRNVVCKKMQRSVEAVSLKEAALESVRPQSYKNIVY